MTVQEGWVWERPVPILDDALPFHVLSKSPSPTGSAESTASSGERGGSARQQTPKKKRKEREKLQGYSRKWYRLSASGPVLWTARSPLSQQQHQSGEGGARAFVLHGATVALTRGGPAGNAPEWRGLRLAWPRIGEGVAFDFFPEMEAEFEQWWRSLRASALALKVKGERARRRGRRKQREGGLPLALPPPSSGPPFPFPSASRNSSRRRKKGGLPHDFVNMERDGQMGGGGGGGTEWGWEEGEGEGDEEEEEEEDLRSGDTEQAEILEQQGDEFPFPSLLPPPPLAPLLSPLHPHSHFQRVSSPSSSNVRHPPSLMSLPVPLSLSISVCPLQPPPTPDGESSQTEMTPHPARSQVIGGVSKSAASTYLSPASGNIPPPVPFYTQEVPQIANPHLSHPHSFSPHHQGHIHQQHGALPGGVSTLLGPSSTGSPGVGYSPDRPKEDVASSLQNTLHTHAQSGTGPLQSQNIPISSHILMNTNSSSPYESRLKSDPLSSTASGPVGSPQTHNRLSLVPSHALHSNQSGTPAASSSLLHKNGGASSTFAPTPLAAATSTLSLDKRQSSPHPSPSPSASPYGFRAGPHQKEKGPFRVGLQAESPEEGGRESPYGFYAGRRRDDRTDREREHKEDQRNPPHVLYKEREGADRASSSFRDGRPSASFALNDQRSVSPLMASLQQEQQEMQQDNRLGLAPPPRQSLSLSMSSNSPPFPLGSSSSALPLPLNAAAHTSSPPGDGSPEAQRETYGKHKIGSASSFSFALEPERLPLPLPLDASSPAPLQSLHPPHLQSEKETAGVIGQGSEWKGGKGRRDRTFSAMQSGEGEGAIREFLEHFSETLNHAIKTAATGGRGPGVNEVSPTHEGPLGSPNRSLSGQKLGQVGLSSSSSPSLSPSPHRGRIPVSVPSPEQQRGRSPFSPPSSPSRQQEGQMAGHPLALRGEGEKIGDESAAPFQPLGGQRGNRGREGCPDLLNDALKEVRKLRRGAAERERQCRKVRESCAQWRDEALELREREEIAAEGQRLLAEDIQRTIEEFVKGVSLAGRSERRKGGSDTKEGDGDSSGPLKGPGNVSAAEEVEARLYDCGFRGLAKAVARLREVSQERGEGIGGERGRISAFPFPSGGENEEGGGDSEGELDGEGEIFIDESGESDEVMNGGVGQDRFTQGGEERSEYTRRQPGRSHERKMPMSKSGQKGGERSRFRVPTRNTTGNRGRGVGGRVSWSPERATLNGKTDRRSMEDPAAEPVPRPSRFSAAAGRTESSFSPSGNRKKERDGQAHRAVSSPSPKQRVRPASSPSLPGILPAHPEDTVQRHSKRNSSRGRVQGKSRSMVASLQPSGGFLPPPRFSQQDHRHSSTPSSPASCSSGGQGREFGRREGVGVGRRRNSPLGSRQHREPYRARGRERERAATVAGVGGVGGREVSPREGQAASFHWQRGKTAETVSVPWFFHSADESEVPRQAAEETARRQRQLGGRAGTSTGKERLSIATAPSKVSRGRGFSSSSFGVPPLVEEEAEDPLVLSEREGERERDEVGGGGRGKSRSLPGFKVESSAFGSSGKRERRHLSMPFHGHSGGNSRASEYGRKEYGKNDEVILLGQDREAGRESVYARAASPASRVALLARQLTDALEDLNGEGGNEEGAEEREAGKGKGIIAAQRQRQSPFFSNSCCPAFDPVSSSKREGREKGGGGEGGGSDGLLWTPAPFKETLRTAFKQSLKDRGLPTSPSPPASPPLLLSADESKLLSPSPPTPAGEALTHGQTLSSSLQQQQNAHETTTAMETQQGVEKQSRQSAPSPSVPFAFGQPAGTGASAPAGTAKGRFTSPDLSSLSSPPRVALSAYPDEKPKDMQQTHERNSMSPDGPPPPSPSLSSSPNRTASLPMQTQFHPDQTASALQPRPGSVPDLARGGPPDSFPPSPSASPTAPDLSSAGRAKGDARRLQGQGGSIADVIRATNAANEKGQRKAQAEKERLRVSAPSLSGNAGPGAGIESFMVRSPMQPADMNGPS
eukprot:Cvel_27646.t1-p1 / transcript=Cvel_27646.t1 / gene=Cvel_27646 / organism=Chromera_velia_CCMP2878 / gene_product=hypothetical protein / transcript_product=hypothetical protein / location=Cvel_scaffold3481:2736-11134(-) / protein_length=2000 / sequence_SO=supercontig / SO=protein_coding / is_pseudo=false